MYRNLKIAWGSLAVIDEHGCLKMAESSPDDLSTQLTYIYIVDIPVISNPPPFTPFAVKVIKIENMNESLLIVELKEILNFHS